MVEIAVNGALGRIGRSVTYELSKMVSRSLDIVLLNDPILYTSSGINMDMLLANFNGHDPIHGRFDWEVTRANENTIKINGQKVRISAERQLSKIPLKESRVKIVEECSGFYGDDKTDKTKRLADEFFNFGIQRVIQSYPANADATIIMGVNEIIYNPSRHRLISNASCTTKALAPLLKIMINYGVQLESLLMDTVHAATKTQDPLETLDQISTHKTGATRALELVIPELKGKMGGLSFRVPTKDGSFANMYMVVSYDGELTKDKLNDIFKRNADGRYRLGVLEQKEVSSGAHIIGRTENALLVLDKTRVMLLHAKKDGRELYHVTLVSGYDNERGPPTDHAKLTDFIVNWRSPNLDAKAQKLYSP